jgi:glutaredoxin
VQPTVVTLLSKPGCHLCDDARVVVATVLEDFTTVAFEELSILDDPLLLEKYVEEIPVVLINNKVHNIWRINPGRLRAALEKETA